MIFSKAIRPFVSCIIITLAIGINVAHADYTDGMIARWNFSAGGLTDSVSGFVLATSGTGTGQTLGFNAGSGSVVLGPGMELISTNLNSVAYPGLNNGMTVWTSLQLTNTPDNLSYLFGLVNANNGIATSSDVTLGLFENLILSSGYWGASFKNSVASSQSGTSLHPLNQFAAVAIVFTNTQAATFYVNGAVVGTASYPGNTFPLQNFKGFALGRLLNTVGNSGGNTFFREARVYSTALAASQIGQIGLANVIAYPDTITTRWDMPVVVNPVTNDYEANGLPLTLVSISPTNATASIVGGTNILITPTLGTAGTAYVGYTITNGNGGSAQSVITVTLTATQAIGSVARADQLVDSIGLNVHLWFPGTPYVTSYSTVKVKLVASKVRHVRDMLAIDRGPVPAWSDLAANGIKTGYIFTPGWAPSIAAYTNYLFTNNLLGTVDYFEGPNEYDSNAGTDTNWIYELTNFQAGLYTTLKGASQTAGYPMLAPSFLINHAIDRAAVGDLSHWSDNGNCHPYPGGYLPSAAQTTNEIAACAINTGSQPIYVTETGYHNATNGPYDGNNPVSETAAALYLPRLYLDSFSRGIIRSYWYEFVDSQTDGGAMNNAEAHFGLIRYDLTEKPAYTAMTNLIAILQDPGTNFVTGNLNYSLSDATVKNVLFQKRDGSFYLALWREVSVWDVNTRTDVVPVSSNVTVNLPGSGYGVQAYSPTLSAGVQQSWSGVSNVTVGLKGEVKILKINGPLPPVANPDTATATWNAPVIVSPLINDHDPNGFPLAIVNVAPTNATASIVNGTNVIITPLFGTTGIAYAGYVITNGNGGTANSLIAVTVVAPPSPAITNILKLENSLVLYGGNGAANGIYQVLSATNLALPVTNWTPILTNTFDAMGDFQVTNDTGSAKPMGFYLIKQ